VIAIAEDRQAGQQSITVSATVQSAVLADSKLKPEILRYRTNLIALALRVIHADDFLERNNISLCLPQHVNYAVRLHAAIKSTALMYVVRRDAKGGIRHPLVLPRNCFECPNAVGICSSEPLGHLTQHMMIVRLLIGADTVPVERFRRTL